MFLIFSLNRPDVLPVHDLGVRAALRDRHGLAELPKPRNATPWPSLEALPHHRELVYLAERGYAPSEVGDGLTSLGAELFSPGFHHRRPYP